jgi:hypothetical protein
MDKWVSMYPNSFTVLLHSSDEPLYPLSAQPICLLLCQFLIAEWKAICKGILPVCMLMCPYKKDYQPVEDWVLKARSSVWLVGVWEGMAVFRWGLFIHCFIPCWMMLRTSDGADRNVWSSCIIAASQTDTAMGFLHVYTCGMSSWKFHITHLPDWP